MDDQYCVCLLYTSKQTKAAADKLGMETYMAEKATIEHLIRLVEEIKHKKERE